MHPASRDVRTWREKWSAICMARSTICEICSVSCEANDASWAAPLESDGSAVSLGSLSSDVDPRFVRLALSDQRGSKWIFEIPQASRTWC